MKAMTTSQCVFKWPETQLANARGEDKKKRYETKIK